MKKKNKIQFAIQISGIVQKLSGMSVWNEQNTAESYLESPRTKAEHV